MKKLMVSLMVLVSLSACASAGYLTVTYKGNSTSVTTMKSYGISDGAFALTASGPSGDILSSYWDLAGMASGDLDGDNVTDVYHSYQNGSETRISSKSVTTSFSSFASATTYGLASVDTNGDGISEACYLGLSGGTVNAYAQNPSGTTTMTVNSVIDSSYTVYNLIAGGDFTGNGVQNNYAFIYRNGESNDYLKVMDSDGNVIRDTAIVNSQWNTAVGVTSGNFSDASAGDELVYVYGPNSGMTGTYGIYIKDSDFETVGSLSVLSQAYSVLGVTAGDLDDDGTDEIVLAYRSASSSTSNVSFIAYEMDGTVLADTVVINGSFNSFTGMTIGGVEVIPEPATMALLGMGAMLGLFRKKRV